mmetsp:Transcript_47641/g.101940  ORF Transcript_47641/g.101940 Transcript_47641/m.101940 type:complete len:175 (-) Transcript_47641:92-616(-)
MARFVFVAVGLAACGLASASQGSALLKAEVKAHVATEQQVHSMVDAKAHAAGATSSAARSRSKDPTALDMTALQGAIKTPTTQAPAAVVAKPKASGEPQPSAGYSYSSVYDRQGARGNPLIWTMSIVYGGLSVLVLVLFFVWSDHVSRQTGPPGMKAKQEFALPAEYTTSTHYL